MSESVSGPSSAGRGPSGPLGLRASGRGGQSPLRPLRGRCATAYRGLFPCPGHRTMAEVMADEDAPRAAVILPHGGGISAATLRLWRGEMAND